MLVGTISIEISEYLADLLKRTSKCRLPDCRQHHHECPLKVPQVLNAKHHEREGQIIAQAGRFGGVTIATNMAGRGTDIILGGNPSRIAEDLFRKQGIDPDTAPAEELDRIRKEARGCGRPTTTAWWRWAACTSSAPSATRRGASTTSSAAAPAVRATPAAPASTSPSRTT